MNDRFPEMLDYITYNLSNKSLITMRKQPEALVNGPKRLQVDWGRIYTIHLTQVPLSIFFQPLTWGVIRPEYIKVPPYDCTIFMKRPNTTVLNASFAPRSQLHKRQMKCRVISYYEAASYLPETYATDDSIAKVDVNMRRFMQPMEKEPTRYAEALWNMAL